MLNQKLLFDLNAEIIEPSESIVEPKIGKLCPQCRNKVGCRSTTCKCGWIFQAHQHKTIRSQVKAKIPILNPKIEYLKKTKPFSAFFNLKEFAEYKIKQCEEFSKELDNNEHPQKLLEIKIQNDPMLIIGLLRVLTGTSNDHLNNFIQNDLPRNIVASKLCQVDEWPKRKGSIIKKIDSLNPAKIKGLANLFAYGNKLHSILPQHFFLLSCDIDYLRSFHHQDSIIKYKIVCDAMQGSYDAMHGNYMEKFYKEICRKLSCEIGIELNILPKTGVKSII
jgi:hypothetical protein